MKTKRIGFILLAALLAMTLVSCDMITQFIASRTRNIAVIQIYNSNKEKTNKLLPNDTLFVEVQGLKPNGVYLVEAVDPEGETITQLTAQADEDGVISPSPLWYDVGFKKLDIGGGVLKPVLPTETELGLNAFNIHVQSLDADAGETMTDFKLPFFVVYNTDISRPQPIVMAGYFESTEFVLENSFEPGQELWVQVANMDDLPPQVPSSTTARVYVVAYKGSAYEEGEDIPNVVFYKDCTVAQLAAGIKLDTTQMTGQVDLSPGGGNDWATIPAWAAGKAFSVIVDVDNNTQYNIRKEGVDDYFLDGIDGNMVPGFVVKNPYTPVDYIPANIASGGIYHWDYATWAYDYDYRDEFKIDGLDTRYAWDWQFGGNGVKATWNPYINWGYGTPTAGVNTASLYYGTYVDLYIIDHPASIPAADSTIVASAKWPFTKITLPVQSSCYNGCGQQTIWRSDGDADETNGGLKLGNFDVVVDVDRNGKFSTDDIIDNQPRNAADPWTPRANGGFSVVTDYSPAD